MNEPFFQFHTGDTFSQNMSAGVHKVNTHTVVSLWQKNNTMQTNYDPEKQTGGDTEYCSCWTIRPGKQQHTVKNCSMTHFCGTNILFPSFTNRKINIFFDILAFTGIRS